MWTRIEWMIAMAVLLTAVAACSDDDDGGTGPDTEFEALLSGEQRGAGGQHDRHRQGDALDRGKQIVYQVDVQNIENVLVSHIHIAAGGGERAGAVEPLRNRRQPGLSRSARARWSQAPTARPPALPASPSTRWSPRSGPATPTSTFTPPTTLAVRSGDRSLPSERSHGGWGRRAPILCLPDESEVLEPGRLHASIPRRRLAHQTPRASDQQGHSQSLPSCRGDRRGGSTRQPPAEGGPASLGLVRLRAHLDVLERHSSDQPHIQPHHPSRRHEVAGCVHLIEHGIPAPRLMEGVPRRDLRRIAEPGIPDHPGWISFHCGFLPPANGSFVATGRPRSRCSWAIRDRELRRNVKSGADRDRTGDPLLAKQVLSQLSYRPEDTARTKN